MMTPRYFMSVPRSWALQSRCPWILPPTIQSIPSKAPIIPAQCVYREPLIISPSTFSSIPELHSISSTQALLHVWAYQLITLPPKPCTQPHRNIYSRKAPFKTSLSRFKITHLLLISSYYPLLVVIYYWVQNGSRHWVLLNGTSKIRLCVSTLVNTPIA